MAEDDSSDLSSLSSLSPVPSDDELSELSDSEPTNAKSKKGILKFFSKVSEQAPKEPSPPPRKRSPSPPHEYVLADNPDIAFIVMFRARFSDALPKSLANFGPQDLERDVVESIPGDRVEHLLCALLGLTLNRKQDVKAGHYGRALEDAITSHKNQWAPSWEDKNPLSGGATFNTMTPTERLTLIRTMILWAMSSSESLKAIINQSYKQNRHEDDLNQARSVQPWGSDGDKRRYFLIEGQDDTAFRVYRESNPAGTSRTWWSVAGSLEELIALADKLEKKDGGPKARKLSQKILAAIPRFEAGDEKRRRREYRQQQKERFKRPEPGFSLYEGRTRGKRMKYTYSDDEGDFYSDSTNRRSARNTGTNTPAETLPTTTASGRQIRAPSRLNVATGESAPGSVAGDASEYDKEGSVGPNGRPKRAAAANGTNGLTEDAGSRKQYNGDSDEEESEAEFGDDEDDKDAHVPEESEEEDEFDEDEAMVDDDLGEEPQSRWVKLSVTPPKLRTALSPLEQANNVQAAPQPEDIKPEIRISEAPLVEMKDAPEPEVMKPAEQWVETVAAANGVSANGESKTTATIAEPETQETKTQEPAIQTVVEDTTTQPPTPKESAVETTSLAVGGSQEKPQAQVLPPPVDVGHHE